MTNKTTKLTLSLVTIGLLLTGCGSSNNPSTPNKASSNNKSNIDFNKYKSMVKSNTFKSRRIATEKQIRKDLVSNAGKNKDYANAISVATNKAPNVKALESYVNKDIEEIYYFNLLKNYVHNLSNIKTKDNSKTISSSDMKTKFKAELRQKFGGRMSEDQLDSIVNKQFGNSSTKTVQQTILAKLPLGATSSHVELKNYDMTSNKAGVIGNNSGMIKITYELSSKDEALNKLASLSNKIKHFLSHDKNWAISDANAQDALQREVLTDSKNDGRNKDFINQMKQNIKEAEARGEDTKYMKKGLAKYTNVAVDKNLTKSDKTSFTYSWYANDNQGRHVITIGLGVQGNKLNVGFTTSMIMM